MDTEPHRPCKPWCLQWKAALGLSLVQPDFKMFAYSRTSVLHLDSKLDTEPHNNDPGDDPHTHHVPTHQVKPRRRQPMVLLPRL